MKLNCKQGYLAVVVRSDARNEGKIVQCVELTVGKWKLGYGPRWVTEPPLFNVYGEVVPPLDACLRPLRDSDGEDEVLRLVGRPVGDPQAA
jgi:hypothetical protein